MRLRRSICCAGGRKARGEDVCRTGISVATATWGATSLARASAGARGAALARGGASKEAAEHSSTSAGPVAGLRPPPEASPPPLPPDREPPPSWRPPPPPPTARRGATAAARRRGASGDVEPRATLSGRAASRGTPSARRGAGAGITALPRCPMRTRAVRGAWWVRARPPLWALSASQARARGQSRAQRARVFEPTRPLSTPEEEERVRVTPVPAQQE